MKKSIYIFLFFNLIVGKNLNSKLSLGIGDSNTGISIIGFSLSRDLNEKNELFIGVGSFLLVNPISIGLKNYIKKNRRGSDYSFYSLQYFNDVKKFAPTIGLVKEKNLSKNDSVQFKAGIMAFLSPRGFGAAPIIGLNINF